MTTEANVRALKYPSNETARLRELNDTGLLEAGVDWSFDHLTRLAADIAGTPIALVTLVDATWQWFKSKHGLSADGTSREASFCTHAILQQNPFMVEDTALDERFQDNPLVLGEPHIRFYAGFPIESQGHRLGALCVVDQVPRKLTAAQQKTLNSLSQRVSAQIQNRRFDA